VTSDFSRWRVAAGVREFNEAIGAG
jgi:hypothetical protein